MKIPWQVEAVIIVTALGLRAISADTATIGYVVLAGYAIIGRAQAVYSLVVLWLFGSLNPGAFAVVENGILLRYVVMAAALVSIFCRAPFGRHGKRDGVVVGTILLGCFLIGHSVVFSDHRQLSVLRSSLWVATMTAIVVAWEDMTLETRHVLVARVVRTMIWVAIASIPLTILPVGYFLNQRGFQGVLNHPQAFGVTMALLGSFAMPAWLFDRRPRWSLAVASLAVGMVVLSGARTGGFALAIGVAGMVLVRWRGRVMEMLRSVLRARMILLIVCVGSTVTLTGGVYQYVQKYDARGGDEGSVVELYVQSRSVLFVPMIRNIVREPVFGIGFGVPSEPEALSKIRTVGGLPVSLGVEKGVMPLAVLEEVGIIGFVVVGMWLWMALRGCVRNGPLAVAAVVTILAVNLGEYVLFSTGGTGILFLVVMGWAITVGVPGGRVPHSTGISGESMRYA